ncbi:uncharacterized protein EI90DRAFT_3071719 [Cantharellus anzutake]|uniref:uncharacterized protein n=1 Tax=Cantharellus anzutake TaxID=1750568 RepID=UPI0019077EEB|nr:uncharacterized protein EI90DRAFT_3071719 [Cantharellus anzutake]KAF8325778.1 hypothetical protein EI90DRAFT_3071719 [Cantharellus anzutake]
MRSTLRPPPLQIYEHPAAHFVSPSSPIFLASPSTIMTSPRVSTSATPRKSRLLLRITPPLSPVTELDETRRFRSLFSDLDTFKSGWYNEDSDNDNAEKGRREEDNLTDLGHELSNVQIIHYSRADMMKSPTTPLFQYLRFESNDPAAMVGKHGTDITREEGTQSPPSSESARSSVSSISGLLSDFPMPPSAVPPAQSHPALPQFSSACATSGPEKTLPSPVSPVKGNTVRGQLGQPAPHLPSRASGFRDDAFLNPRPAPRPPARSVSTPNLKLAAIELTLPSTQFSLDASTSRGLASRRAVKRPAKLEHIPPPETHVIIDRNTSSSSSASSMEEMAQHPQIAAPVVNAPRSPSRRRTCIPTETSVNSPWRETIDALYTKPPVPPKPTHFLPLTPGPSTMQSRGLSPKRVNTLPITSATSSSSILPMKPATPISLNATVPRGILKNRLHASTPLPPPTPSLSSHPYQPHTPSAATPSPRHPPSRSHPLSPISLPTSFSTPPSAIPSTPSPLTPPNTPYTPPYDRTPIKKPPTPPKSYVIPSPPSSSSVGSSSLSSSFSESESSGSETKHDIARKMKTHSRLGSRGTQESIRVRYLRRGASTSSRSSLESVAEGEGRSTSRAGSRMSSGSVSSVSRHSSSSSRSVSGLPARSAIPLALLIR